ncbi:hypothetical protein AB5I41_03810 [Sphingomonas sp. MMS24-JH45]
MATSRARFLLAAAGALGSARRQSRRSAPICCCRPASATSAPTPAPTQAAPAPDASGAIVQPLPGATPLPLPSVSPSPSPSPTNTVSPFQLPAFARRPLSRVGVWASGIPAAAFGTMRGPTVEILMRRLSVLVPSRWLSIALRRLLVAPVDTPAGVNGADFAAERAWLLLRMGELVAARAVAQGVDTGEVTPKLRQVWMQAALATADCWPVPARRHGGHGRARLGGRARDVHRAVGGGNAQAPLRDIRRRRVASGVDLQLAQKVMGAALNSRQAITIEWTPVVQLTAWCFGLATATGVATPTTSTPPSGRR